MATEPTPFAVTYPYSREDSSRLDLDYYLNHHIPTTKAAWESLGMTGCIVCDVDESSEFALVVVMLWKDRAAWDNAKVAEVTQKLVDDVKNFTDVIPLVVPGKILT
jgi:hypothetical protein